MKPNILNRFRITQLLLGAALLGTASFANAANQTWNLAGATDNWNSTDNNWTGAWVNTGANAAIFSASTPESITLTENIFANGLTVSSNNATPYTFNLGSGIDLNVNGNVTIGVDGDNTVTKATFAGLGAFNIGDGITNRTFQVGGAVDTVTPASNVDNTATLDMSGLSTFSANLGTGGTFRVGDIGAFTDSAAVGASTAILAKNSTITTGTLDIGGTTAHTSTQTLKLGDTSNIINANSIYVGSSTASGQRSSGAIQFNTGSGTLQIRAANGTGRANMDLVNTSQATGAPLAGTVDLTGHSSNLLLGTLAVAVRTGNTGGSATSTFSFDTGTLDVSTITLATKTGTTTGGFSTGTVNIGGGIANIGSIAMASVLTAGSTATATINLTGGVTTLGGNITRTGGATGTSTATINLQGGTLNMSGNNIGAANAVTLNAQSGTLSNLGQLNNGGALTKTTGGTLIIGGTNNYTGATNVTGGTLLINGSTHASSAFTVGASGTLGGTGAIGGTVSVDGTLAPGASIESLSTGAVTFNNNSTFAYEFNSATLGGDLLNTEGALSLTNTVTLTLNELSTGTLALGDTLTLISYDTTWNGGLFAYADGNDGTLTDGETFTLGNNQFVFDYNNTSGGSNFSGEQTGDNRFVTVTVVPEPAAALLGSLGLLAMLRRRRN